MPHRLRKVRKQRGSRTHGWGQIGQHRCHGMKGGRGKAGLHKHKWTYTVKYAPEYFTKKGFKSHTGQGKVEAINLNQLDQKVDALIQSGKLKDENGKYTVDLEELGYAKLLGSGRLTKPLTVKTRLCSKMAAEKIQSSGGTLILTAAQKEES